MRATTIENVHRIEFLNFFLNFFNNKKVVNPLVSIRFVLRLITILQ